MKSLSLISSGRRHSKGRKSLGLDDEVDLKVPAFGELLVSFAFFFYSLELLKLRIPEI